MHTLSPPRLSARRRPSAHSSWHPAAHLPSPPTPRLTVGLTAMLSLTLAASGALAAPTALSVAAGKTLTVQGDLAQGKNVALAFASKSAIACFPMTRNQHFDGKHVFYVTRLPAHSVLTATVTPEAGTDVSLYAYTGNGLKEPPMVYSVVSCEASYLMSERNRTVTSNPGAPERVQLSATTHPYDVIIAVAGAGGAAKGRYKLALDLKTAAAGVPDTGPPPAQVLTARPGATVKLQGDIGGGKRIPLQWAANSNVSCFPATRFQHFDGNHVVYKTKLPPQSSMTVTLKPKPGVDLSLYAYSANGHPLPPKVSGAVCEASYLMGEKNIKVTANPGKPEQVQLRAIKNGYDVVIGVAGAGQATAGGFELEVKLETADAGVADTGPPPVANLAVAPNTTAKLQGDIRGGKRIPLQWAANSNVACFPATRFLHFDGNHVVYKTKLPPQSSMTVTLKPKPGVDLSLYAYSANGHPLPPKVPGANCEASYLMGEKSIKVTANPGKPEQVQLRAIKNGYDVVIGVAGAGQATAGGFELEVKLETADAGVADTGPPPVANLAVAPNTTAKLQGDIRGGRRIPLQWAANSNVACFPATRFLHFDGNHVVYKTKLPPQSSMTVTLKPKPGVDLSLYAYSANGHPLPPKVPGANCEASYLMGEKNIKVTANPGKPEQVQLRAIKNGYDVVIGVAGAGQATAGGFELEVKLETAGAGVPDTGPPPVTSFVTKGIGQGAVELTGDIATGKELPLQWAANSNVACFPATRFLHFDGRHVAYTTKLGARSKMVIELIPAPGVDLSLYAYAANGHPLPPKLYGARCEASYLFGEKSHSVTANPGKPEVVEIGGIKPYDIVIGVAGAHKAAKGSFKLKVTVKPF